MSRSQVLKRSVVLDGRKTSISLEDAFWTTLKDASAATGQSVGALVAQIDGEKAKGANLSSAIRLFVLDHVLSRRAA